MSNVYRGSQQKSVYTTALSGGIAGGIEILTMYPLDVAKTRQQLLAGSTLNSFHILRMILNDIGWRGMYRGVCSPLIAETPKRAIKFATNEMFKPHFSTSELTPVPLIITRLFIAGGMAGSVETIVNCPFEVVKARIQAPQISTVYGSSRVAVGEILQKEGLLALYKGFQPQLLRNIIWNGTYFSIIGYQQHKKKITGTHSQNQIWRDFCVGSLASAAGTFLSTPLDVVKSRMQNLPSVSPRYQNSLSALFQIYSEEGYQALFKGLGPRLLRLGPGGGIMFVVFDLCNRILS